MGADDRRDPNADLLENLGYGPPWRPGDLLEELQQEYVRTLRARDSLVRCALYARKPEVNKLQDEEYMKRHDFSVLVCPLDDALPFSGPGLEQGHIIWAFGQMWRMSGQ
ncbi:Uncharacterized protein SCF082_LOCUS27917 [Durusdinium trenchii]|uniref:Uncharacterized protein n=1 Tax=Durusdinium trenchii TaxID=1381693 RepID=A0ABP0MGT8_9DINO